jgi:hypothetical protein
MAENVERNNAGVPAKRSASQRVTFGDDEDLDSTRRHGEGARARDSDSDIRAARPSDSDDRSTHKRRRNEIRDDDEVDDPEWSHPWIKTIW